MRMRITIMVPIMTVTMVVVTILMKITVARVAMVLLSLIYFLK